jgi:hypothetical protein
MGSRPRGYLVGGHPGTSAVPVEPLTLPRSARPDLPDTSGGNVSLPEILAAFGDELCRVIASSRTVAEATRWEDVWRGNG